MNRNRIVFARLAALVFAVACALPGANAQTPLVSGDDPSASRIDLVLAGGLNTRPGLSGDLGLRVGLGPKYALELTGGTPQWGARDASHDVELRGGRLSELRLQSGPLFSAHLKGYQRAGRSGWYGGIGGGLQSYRVQAQSTFPVENPDDPFIVNSGNTAIDLFATLFGALLSNRNRDIVVARESRGTVFSVQGQAGYAFGFAGGQRLEVGARVIARSLSKPRYTLATVGGDSERSLARDFRPVSLGVEARYVVPLIR